MGKTQTKTYVDDVKDICGSDRLYHFVSYNAHSLEIFINKQIFFSSLDTQNDPFDSSFNISEINGDEENVIKFLRNQYSNTINPAAANTSDPIILNHRDNLLDNIEIRRRIIKNYIIKQVKAETGIFCMSKHPKNITMWSHYSQNGKGFCIIFDKAKLESSLIHGIDSGYFLLPKNVNYSIIPKINVLCYGLGLFFKPESILFNKIGYWKDEDEYRIVMTRIADEKDRYHNIKLSCIKGIIVLSQVAPFEVTNTLKNIMLNRCKELPADFYWINASLDEVKGMGLRFSEDLKFKRLFRSRIKAS